jgi:hypothetical protein
MIDEATDLAKGTLQDAQEVIKQRFFSPMYFYFLISWMATNWKFVFTWFFIDSSDISDSKIDYLTSFYSFDSFLIGCWSMCKILFLPALSAYLFVWWFSQLSEKFYKRNETFKMNKIGIKRFLDYEEKVKIAGEQRKIRDEESDKDELRYIDYEEFNNYLNEGQENITISGIDYLPSEVLFGTDPESYKAQFNSFIDDEKIFR